MNSISVVVVVLMTKLNKCIDIDKLKAAREAKNISITSVSRRLNIKRSKLTSYRRCEVEMPATILFQLCSIYNITPSDVYCADDICFALLMEDDDCA